MAVTTYTDNVEILGSQNINQLKVKGHTTQTTPLQDWQDSTGASKASLDNSGKLTASGFTMATGAVNNYVLTADSCGNGTWKLAPGAIGSSSAVCNGRLTIASGTPVPMSDVTNATTIYFTPYKGNGITIYTGTAWATYAFSELSVPVPSGTNTNYDVFVYDNSGTLTLSTVAWTNDTTRATSLVPQDGIWVKSGAITYRYLGTIRTTGTSGQCEDSTTKRYVYNEFNQVSRELKITEATASWTYTPNVWRAANNSTANRVSVVVGNAGPLANLDLAVRMTSTGQEATAGIGYDRTDNSDADLYQNTLGPVLSIHLKHYPGVGFHYYQWVENGHTATTCTYYSGTVNTSGIVGDISM